MTNVVYISHTSGFVLILINVIFFLTYVSAAEYEHYEPRVTLEALRPSGFKVFLPAAPGVTLFAFHGKINKPITELEPGDLSEDLVKPENGYFVYFNPNLKLKVGDKVNYWVFVRREGFGYRVDEQTWEVPELVEDVPKVPVSSCKNTQTVTSRKGIICKNSIVLEYLFVSEKIDPNVWTVEQYIADRPDYEFVVYKKDSDVIFVSGNLLHIVPKVAQTRQELTTTLDVSNGCTSSLPHECIRSFGGLYQPPIISAKIVSKVHFAFGKVEVRAKLPIGDWLYSEIYLQDVNESNNRIMIAFVRGNKILQNTNQEDIGNKLLMGGIINPLEEYNNNVMNYTAGQALGNEMHKFKVIWKKEGILLYIDDIKYGSLSGNDLKSAGLDKANMKQLVIRVAAGGIHAFPDEAGKEQYIKPWSGKERNMVKKFFDSKSVWHETWNPESTQLQVEYVKITAV